MEWPARPIGMILWTITLNCDEHRLHIIDENTNEEDKIDVDISQAF